MVSLISLLVFLSVTFASISVCFGFDLLVSSLWFELSLWVIIIIIIIIIMILERLSHGVISIEVVSIPTSDRHLVCLGL